MFWSCKDMHEAEELRDSHNFGGHASKLFWLCGESHKALAWRPLAPWAQILHYFHSLLSSHRRWVTMFCASSSWHLSLFSYSPYQQVLAGGARLFHIRKNWLRWVFITSTRPAKIEHSNSSACIQCYTSNLHDLIIVIPMTTRLVQICNLFWMEGVLCNKAAINQIELCTRFAKNWIRDCWPGNCTVPTTDLALPIKFCEEHEPPYCCIVRYNPVYDMH